MDTKKEFEKMWKELLVFRESMYDFIDGDNVSGMERDELEDAVYNIEVAAGHLYKIKQ